ncbi:MAG: DinB family protein [Terriglobales bacterium]
MKFLSEAITRLSSTPQRVKEFVDGISETQLSWRATPQSFSVRENVLHLRDIDVEGYEHRIRVILSEDNPMLPDVDGGKLARERDYNRQPVQPALDDLRRSRAASMERLKGCSEAHLLRKAEMQGVGVIDLRRLLELWIEHDRGHLADLAELRRAIETGERPSFARHQAA